MDHETPPRGTQTPPVQAESYQTLSGNSTNFVARRSVVTPDAILSYVMSKKAQTPPKSFEDAMAELEKILNDMESGTVSLEESLAKYERGNFLIQHCRGVLGQAEKQIELLSKTAEGNLASEPLDDTDEGR